MRWRRQDSNSKVMATKPRGMSEHAEQLRPPIVRGEGVTASERYLAKLGEKSFLNLWFYPNTFRDQMDHPDASQGKELCDLLVVCATHIIIFSEKAPIAWQADKPMPVACSRWFRGAVADSVKQIRGAERWISQHPMHLPGLCMRNTRCPSPCRWANDDSSRRYRARGWGSLPATLRPGSRKLQRRGPISRVRPTSVPATAVSRSRSASATWMPMGRLLHVLDETSLDIAMHELDTITDFTAYLKKKEAFIRAGRLAKVEGEENLNRLLRRPHQRARRPRLHPPNRWYLGGGERNSH